MEGLVWVLSLLRTRREDKRIEGEVGVVQLVRQGYFLAYFSISTSLVTQGESVDIGT
jgi:hypothetical protein